MTETPPQTAAGTAQTKAPLPLPEPLAPEELNRRIETMVGIIRLHGCGDLAQRVAEGIAASDVGGRAVNVQNAFPQLSIVLPNGATVLNGQLDQNADHKLTRPELVATVLAAGSWLARNPGKTPADVPLNQEFLDILKERCEELQGPKTNSCSLPTASPLIPTRANAPEKGAQR